MIESYLLKVKLDMLNHIFAINIAKITSYLSKKLNIGSGTSLPGMLAQKISPGLLPFLVNQTKKEIIFVTGTNGKTTTSGLIASILKENNSKIAHNRKGANMLSGIITAICQSSNNVGTMNVDNCLLEIDEAYLPVITEMISPNIIALTNLFRDQLDRYGELDTTAKKIFSGIEKIKHKEKLTVTVNADDPITLKVAQKIDCTKVYYGIENIIYSNNNTQYNSQSELATCACGKNFKYKKNFYSHIGHFYCECGNNRFIPDIIATNVEINVDFSDISLVTPIGSFSFRLNLPGLYNVYNALCAVSIAVSLDIDSQAIINGIENYSTVFGRSETLVIKDKQVLIQLIKNPVGATEVLKTISNDPNAKIIIAINDNYADGRDVSWLWDAGFDLLKSYNENIICSGTRAHDMAVRLKYADINPELIKTIPNIKEALLEGIKTTTTDQKLYILPTYTVLLEMQTFLNKL